MGIDAPVEEVVRDRRTGRTHGQPHRPPGRAAKGGGVQEPDRLEHRSGGSGQGSQEGSPFGDQPRQHHAVRHPPWRHLQFVASLHRSDCFRLERQLPGGIRTRWDTAPFHGARQDEGNHSAWRQPPRGRRPGRADGGPAAPGQRGSPRCARRRPGTRWDLRLHLADMARPDQPGRDPYPAGASATGRSRLEIGLQ